MEPVIPEVDAEVDVEDACEDSVSTPPAAARVRHRFLFIMTLSCVVLVPWIVFLALTLPHHYVTDHWSATWVGFDAILLVALITTAWLAWRRRQAVVLGALITATLLVTDAWFDVMTASSDSDMAMSAASALFIELPLAVILLRAAARLVRYASHRARVLAGEANPDLALWRLPLFGLPTAEEPEPAKPSDGR